MNHDRESPHAPRAPQAPQAIAVVQEVSCTERAVVLKVRRLGADMEQGAGDLPKTTLLVVASPTGGAPAGAGLLTSEQRRELWGGRLPAGLSPQRAREDALAHARIVSLHDGAVYIEQQGLSRIIRATRDRVVVTNEDVPTEARPFMSLTLAEREPFAARGLELARALARAAIDERRVDVLRVLDKAIERIGRRQVAIRGDLAKIAQADEMASRAEWLIAEASRTPRGATKLVATDWSTGEAVPIEIPLDPSKSAKEQVLAMFRRAKRLRIGARIAEERLAQTEAQLAGVRAERAEIVTTTSLAAIEEHLLRAKRAAPRDVTLPGSAAAQKARGPDKASGRVAYRTFAARSGRKLLVGKGAADNDTLTLHVARPHDLWVHAKDRTGAHVIAALDRGHACPSEDLVDAAHLAAHFSDARDEAVVDVQYTERRYIRKPKGSAPGFVVVEREKVLVLRVDAPLVRTLLEREDL